MAARAADRAEADRPRRTGRVPLPRPGRRRADVREERNVAEEWVQREAQALHEVAQRAAVLPDDDRAAVGQHLATHLTHTVAEE